MFKRFMNLFVTTTREINKDRFVETFNHYDGRIRIDRYPDFSVLKFGIGTFVVVATTCAVFRKNISKYVGSVIDSDDVKNKVTILLNDEKINDASTQLAKSTASALMSDQEFKNLIQNNIGLSLESACNDGNNQKLLADFFIKVFSRQDIQTQINTLLNNTCNDKYNQDIVAKLLIDVLQRDDVRDVLINKTRDTIARSFIPGYDWYYNKNKIE